MIYIYPETENKKNGFAIGVILMTLVIISGIIAAIAAGSRGSSSITNSESARVQASSLLTQASNIRSDIELAISDGYAEFRLEETDADCDTVIFCLYNTTSGYGTIPVVPDSIAVSGSKWQWGSVRIIAGGNDFGSSVPDSVIGLAGIKSDVCQQINAILKGHEPDIYNNSADDGSDIITTGTLTTTSGIAIDSTITIDRAYKAGCFEDDGADPSGDNDYSYIEIIDVK